jgi:alpha-tubulin suppressor-like RCC1 family protein
MIVAGLAFSCGIAADSTAYCWGNNNDGKLGDGTTTAHDVPTPIASALKFIDISASDLHACALDRNGAAYCWGFNGVGELGNGTSGSAASSSTPVAVSGGLTFVDIEVGRQFSCARTAAGALYCWGGNGGGQHGVGNFSSSTTPRLAAGGQTFTEIGTSQGMFNAYMCGVAAGSGNCWGENAIGEVGDGSHVDRLTPALVTGGQTWRAIDPGREHTCGVTTGNAVFCWGDNTRGQLGIGSRQLSLVPVAVLSSNTYRGLPVGSNYLPRKPMRRTPGRR